MKKKKLQLGYDTGYAKRSRVMTPEARMDWLAAAVEFARAPKKILKK